MDDRKDKVGVSADPAVAKGSCVMFTKDGDLAYVGPLKGSPDKRDTVMILNPEDMVSLRTFVERKKAAGGQP